MIKLLINVLRDSYNSYPDDVEIWVSDDNKRVGINMRDTDREIVISAKDVLRIARLIEFEGEETTE